MATSRHFLSSIGFAGLTTTRRFSYASAWKASLLERHRTPWRPPEANYPAHAGCRDEMAIRMQADGVRLSGATVHCTGWPAVLIGSVARANRRKEMSADCKISPMLW